MSLLDDVSIVVTPNGYKAGELYAVVPVPTEGAEEVVNGTFLTNTSSGWNDWNNITLPANSSQQDGYGILDATSGTCDARQDVTVEIGKTYLIESTQKEDSGGAGRLYMSDGANYSYAFGSFISTATETTFKQYVVPTQTTIRLYAYNSGSAKAYFTNVSIKEALTVSADMDVTRATAATRVDEAGLVNYAEIIGSEEVTNGDFATDTDWAISGGNADITSGLLNFTNATSFGTSVNNSSVVVSGKAYTTQYTISNYTSGAVRIRVGSTYGAQRTSNGTYTEIINASGTLIQLYSTSANTTLSIDNVSVKEVTRDNVPRIDYTGGGCPHILAEPQRTNLIPYSEDLTNAFYNTQALETVTQSLTLSPDGVNYGYTITPNTSTSNHWLDYTYAQVTVTIGNEITYSIFVKPNGYNFIQIASSSGFPARYQNFELTGDGVIGTGDVNGKTIEKIGDWYRCSVTETSSGVNPRFLLLPSETALATRNPSYSGNGTDGVLGWGVQVEVGSYPTSYIPNFGTAAGVTRNQDQFTRDGIGSLINSTEGVLFLEGGVLSDDGTNQIISLLESSSSRLSLTFSSALNRIQFYAAINGYTNSVTINAEGFNKTQINKIAIRYGANNYALFINGVKEGENTAQGNAFTVGSLSELTMSNSNPFYGKVKQLQVYKTALTDTQLAALTS